MKSVEKATVMVDASWCPQTCAGGWAVWITINTLKNEVKRVQHHAPFKSLARNNVEAETWAIVNGIALARKHVSLTAKLLVQSDCLPAMHYLKTKESHLLSHVKMRHVKAHNEMKGDARSWVNGWCDRYARKHMRLMRDKLLKSEENF